jgi:RND superfamily putative drug exporter
VGRIATVAVDVIAALTVLPALLAVLGHRVNALAVRKSVRAGAVARPEKEGGWYRFAHVVMRRPVAIAAVIVIVLLALGAPFLRISWGGTDARVLPTSRAGLAAYTANIGAIPGVTGVEATAVCPAAAAPAPFAWRCCLTTISCKNLRKLLNQWIFYCKNRSICVT